MAPQLGYYKTINPTYFCHSLRVYTLRLETVAPREPVKGRDQFEIQHARALIHYIGALVFTDPDHDHTAQVTWAEMVLDVLLK